MSIHRDLPESELHEPKHIQAATGGASDAGKVIVAVGDGTSELRKLTAADIGVDVTHTVVVKTEADFPAAVTAPDGAQRHKLAKDTCYLLDPDFDVFTLANGFWIEEVDTDFLRASTIDSTCNTLVNYTGTDTLFYGPSVSFFSSSRVVYTAAVPGTQAFDIQGSLDPATISVVEMNTASFLGFSMGRIINVGASKLDFVAVLPKGPLRVHNSSILVAFVDMQFNTTVFGVMNKPCILFTGSHDNIAIRNLRPTLLAGDSFLSIDSGVSATTQVDIEDTGYPSAATFPFFEPDLSGSLTAMQDLATLVSGAVTAYEDHFGVGVKVTHNSVSSFDVGSQVTHSGTTNYNGTFRITAILSNTEYVMDATYVADEVTGSFVGAGTRVTASAAHNFDEFRQVTISGTTSYNGDVIAYNTTTTQFDIDTTFVANDGTGSYLVTSIDQTSPLVTAANNGVLPASAKVAAIQTNANAALTTVTASTYLPLNLGTASTLDIERFALTTAAEGKVTCTSREGFRGLLTAVLTVDKTGGGGSNYRFAIGINGAAPVFASAPYTAAQIAATDVTVPMVFPVTLEENDTVQIYIAGDATGDDVTVTDATLIFRE